MKIGTLLHLEHKKAGEEVQKFRCKVIEKGDGQLFIDYPVNAATHRTSFFPVGTKFSAAYVGEDQVIYQFQTEITAKVNRTIPALAVTIPDKSRIKRIQRRKYVRVKSSLDLAVHSANGRFSPFTAITSDISGGGLSFLLPDRPGLTEHEPIELCIALQQSLEPPHFIRTSGEIVYIKTEGYSMPVASLKFISIPAYDQQVIIQFCFEKQRQTRKKELL
ncbi:flagellar brake protein [Lentibacillus sediminis]|uniref:flagellar brake protein n=1 Tax=Lentibacillus sediminis TaxID=1940529 RepID=UPI000C1C3CB2|nr:flagellar brake domain-containing protein [Lentibacillus sediminis]